MSVLEAQGRPVEVFVAPPPRNVPWTVRVRVLFESTALVWIWIFFGIFLLASAEFLRRVVAEPAAVVAAIIPLAGAAAVAWTWRIRVRWLRLLSHGRFTQGTLVGMRWTNTVADEMPNTRYYALMTFSFTTETGRRQEIKVRTPDPERLQAAPVQRILYNPADPRIALVWPQLPPSVSFDARGQLRPAELLGTVVWLLPPAVALLLAVIGYTHR